MLALEENVVLCVGGLDFIFDLDHHFLVGVPWYAFKTSVGRALCDGDL